MMDNVGKTITQAELRNGSAAVLDAVEAGAEFIVTRNGRTVAELRPIEQSRGVSPTEFKRRLAGFAAADSAAEQRAEIDAVFE